jgi:pimeloyl-ACP methyl ester carboxylesterase
LGVDEINEPIHALVRRHNVVGAGPHRLGRTRPGDASTLDRLAAAGPATPQPGRTTPRRCSWIAAQVRQCRDALTANPRFYTHAESLADVDEIRERLGYETINLWGGSWGTRAAYSGAWASRRDFPDHRK